MNDSEHVEVEGGVELPSDRREDTGGFGAVDASEVERDARQAVHSVVEGRALGRARFHREEHVVACDERQQNDLCVSTLDLLEGGREAGTVERDGRRNEHKVAELFQEERQRVDFERRHFWIFPDERGDRVPVRRIGRGSGVVDRVFEGRPAAQLARNVAAS